jgi:hypothetical protein
MLTLKGFTQKQQQWMESIEVKMGTYQETGMIMFRKMIRTNKMMNSLQLLNY